MSKSVLKAATDRALRKVTREAEEAGPVVKSKKRPAEAIEEAPAKAVKPKKAKTSSDKPIGTAVVEKSAGHKGAVVAGNVIYLGHIPDGFYEPQMDKFFKQFGEVKRIKLFRSEKSNRSKGYAFIEFESPEVAAIVAESMDGYFLMERKMVSHIIPTEKIHDKMFAKPKRVRDDASDDEDEEFVQPTIDDQNFSKVAKVHAKSMAQKQAKLRELGIDYDIPFAAPLEERAAPAPAPVAAPILAAVPATTPAKGKKAAAKKAGVEVEEPVVEAAKEPVVAAKAVGAVATATPGKTRATKKK